MQAVVDDNAGNVNDFLLLLLNVLFDTVWAQQGMSVTFLQLEH